MAEAKLSRPEEASTSSSAWITSFGIHGLFGQDINYKINFPDPRSEKGGPSLLILAGPNGCGKTTILKMIEGMLQLNFDIFRQIPFRSASLELSTGDRLIVTKQDNLDFPLDVQFGDDIAHLAKDRTQKYPQDLDAKRIAFRSKATPILDGIHFELLDIHRSMALRLPHNEEPQRRVHPGISYSEAELAALGIIDSSQRRPRESLATKVRNFVREAQVNYRKYFEAEQLELLPRILHRLSTADRVGKKEELCAKLESIRSRSPALTRLGMQTDEADLKTLAELLSEPNSYTDKASLAVFQAYVEMQENRNQTRELIAKRLENFEEIMAEFLVGKTVKVDGKRGLRIHSGAGELEETDLSSGEYHFLYMMVAALLCLRTGSIIAIDEPELSLHVSWQRKIVSALAKCASGASPLFLFATHSSAISAEHRDRVVTLVAGE